MVRSMERTFSLLVLMGLLAGAASCESGSPEDGTKSRAVQTIVRTTNSPFCPGKTLDSCPSPKAAAWRTDINEWVEADVPVEEIRERLQDRVPAFDLEPKPVSSGWLIPLIAVLVSTVWFVVMARRLRRRVEYPRVGAEPVHDGLDARLDEELAKLD